MNKISSENTAHFKQESKIKEEVKFEDEVEDEVEKFIEQTNKGGK